MEVYIVFTQLKKIENIVGELYTFLYRKISHLYPDIGDLFKQLADEENEHFETNKNAESLIHSMLESVNEKSADIKNRIVSISPGDLLKAIFDLENDLEARHYSVYIIVKDEQIKSLLNSLASMDEAHRDKIKSFMEKYKKNT